MSYNDLTDTEKEYVDKLLEEQKAVYMAQAYKLDQLRIMASRLQAGKEHLDYFIDISYLLLELHNQHQKYNDNMDLMAKMPNNTDSLQKTYESFYDANEQMFTCNINIGQKSVRLDLYYMDSTDYLYNYLSAIKMQAFNLVLDYLTADDFSEYM